VLIFGDDHGVANQRADQERMAQARGYDIVLSAADNDISAFTGKHRPGYEKVMAAAAAGEIDVILVFQTSRFWRNRRERAEAIEILRKAGVSIIATRGPSLDMTTAYGRAMAGLLGEFDTMESEVKSERQQFANHAAATAGKVRKGSPRPFGWQEDRITPDPAEAAAIRDACQALLAGGTVAGIAREWERRGLRSHQAPFGPLPERPWSRVSIREILRNPRNAGIAVYKGTEMGRGEWEPIVPEETWRAVTEVLADSGRGPGRGATALLSGIGLCQCGNTLAAKTSANGLPAYRCNPETRNGRPGPHVQVLRAGPDAAVSAAVIDALADPDAIRLITPLPDGEAIALRDEELILRARLARLGALFADGKISEQDMISGRERGTARLAEIAGRLAELGRGNVLAPFITAGDIAAAWEAAGIDVRRAVVDALMTVTLYPSGRGARTFDPGRVLPPGRGIIWKS